jgi:hypothetical protein
MSSTAKAAISTTVLRTRIGLPAGESGRCSGQTHRGKLRTSRSHTHSSTATSAHSVIECLRAAIVRHAPAHSRCGGRRRVYEEPRNHI